MILPFEVVSVSFMVPSMLRELLFRLDPPSIGSAVGRQCRPVDGGQDAEFIQFERQPFPFSRASATGAAARRGFPGSGLAHPGSSGISAASREPFSNVSATAYVPPYPG